MYSNMTTPYQKAQFVLSAADLKQLPPDFGVEVAIVGRSNAGKSSVLNRLTKQKQLARVSKTPGRTQLINVFHLTHEKRLMDLPGYGFAKVPPAVRREWEALVGSYFEERQSLKGVLVIMDIRHPLRPLDEHLLSYCEERQIKVHVLLNKSDKLSRGEAAKTYQTVKAKLAASGNEVTVQLFSASKGIGLPELEQQLDIWYDDRE
jgi:GTP-binding protein